MMLEFHKPANCLMRQLVRAAPWLANVGIRSTTNISGGSQQPSSSALQRCPTSGSHPLHGVIGQIIHINWYQV